MAMKTIYIPDKDLPLWEEATEIAKRRKTSLSKVIATEVRNFVREQKGDSPGLPIGFAVPASMKDPTTVKIEAAADRIQAVIVEELRELAES